MTSSIPYFIRSLNEWILDNGCTPYLIVNTEFPDVIVPLDSIKDGQIVLNISPQAIRDLNISNEHVMFSGRFGGKAFEVSFPVESVMGIIAQENGEGMWFSQEKPEPDPEKQRNIKTDEDPKRNRPELKVIK